MATDFFDDDLAEPAPVDYPAATLNHSSKSNDSYHARQKRELPEAQASTGDEIERLRMRQQELEKRKQEIVEQRHRIELLERNKSDLLEKLRRNNVLVVRQGEQAARAAAICKEAGTRFTQLHQDIDSINPDAWDEADYGANLVNALAKVDSATNEYRAAMDRVAAVDWHAPQGAMPDVNGLEGPSGSTSSHGFTYWLLAGFAFTLPVIIVFILLALYLGMHFANA